MDELLALRGNISGGFPIKRARSDAYPYRQRPLTGIVAACEWLVSIVPQIRSGIIYQRRTPGCCNVRHEANKVDRHPVDASRSKESDHRLKQALFVPDCDYSMAPVGADGLRWPVLDPVMAAALCFVGLSAGWLGHLILNARKVAFRLTTRSRRRRPDS